MSQRSFFQLALALSRVDDSRTFWRVLEGFVMFGSEARPHLIKLNRLTREKQSAVVRSALMRIGEPKTPLASGKVSSQDRPMPRQSSRLESSHAKRGSSAGVMSRSEWLKRLRSDDYDVLTNALRLYETAKDSLNLETLSHSEKSALVKLCGARLKAEYASVSGDTFGRILLDFADRSSIPLFEELARSRETHDRVHGLAGLMKFSERKAVETSVRMESKPLGIFTIVKAAKLVGPESLPTLKVLRRTFRKWSSQRWIDGAIQDLK